MELMRMLNYLMRELPLGMVRQQKLLYTGGSITNFDVIDGGSGYGAEKLEFDPTFIGSPSIGAAATFTSVGLSTNIGDVVTSYGCWYYNRWIL